MTTRLDCLKAATRMALFENDWPDWEYSTEGGTVFVVAYANRPFGITATHVGNSFNWPDLCVMNEKLGRQIAGLKAVNRATNLVGDAEGSDIGDVTIIEFSDDTDVEFFTGGFYTLDAETTGQSETDDALIAYGVPKDHTTIVAKKITPTFAQLGFQDNGPHPYDPFLRRLIGQWREPVVTNLTGMSGCGVFNTTRDVLTGVMLRGGFKDNLASGLFIDIADVMRILEAIVTGTLATDYRKIVRHKV